jgi:hypothetical protein
VRSESIDIALRAYVPSKKARKESPDTLYEERPVLVIDTETTEDEYLNLRFGSCGIWISGHVHKLVLFYDPVCLREISIFFANTLTVGKQRTSV